MPEYLALLSDRGSKWCSYWYISPSSLRDWRAELHPGEEDTIPFFTYRVWQSIRYKGVDKWTRGHCVCASSHERWRYIVTSFPIGRAHKNDPCERFKSCLSDTITHTVLDIFIYNTKRILVRLNFISDKWCSCSMRIFIDNGIRKKSKRPWFPWLYM